MTRGDGRRVLVLGAVALFAPLLSACSNAGATTCAEFGAMSYEDRDDVLKDLLEEHRLEPMALSNNLGIEKAVNSFCGTRSPLLGDAPSTQNLDRPIGESHDWDSPQW